MTFHNELDIYPINIVKNITVSNLYDGQLFIGYQNKILFLDGHYRKKIYDKNGQIMSDMKYFSDGGLNTGNLYQNGTLYEYIKITKDDRGFVHEIHLDAKNNVISHKKFDSANRFVGGCVYENGVLLGTKRIQYTESGVYETVFDTNYHILLSKKIDPKMYSDPKQPQIQEIVTETHEISVDETGAIYETVFDAKHHIISAPKLLQKPRQNNR